MFPFRKTKAGEAVSAGCGKVDSIRDHFAGAEARLKSVDLVGLTEVMP
jgi:hypothetical protein